MYQDHTCVFVLMTVVFRLKHDASGGTRHTAVEAGIVVALIPLLPSPSRIHLPRLRSSLAGLAGRLSLQTAGLSLVLAAADTAV